MFQVEPLLYDGQHIGCFDSSSFSITPKFNAKNMTIKKCIDYCSSLGADYAVSEYQ